MNNGRTEKLLKNVLLFFLASFGTKFLSFFLVPFYTSLLTTDEYGTVDLLNTIVSLILPIMMLDISDAIMYFSFQSDNVNDRKNLLKYGMKILSISSGILLIILSILCITFKKIDFTLYCIYIIFYYIVSAFQLNILAYMRANDMVNTIVITSIISSGVTLISNVIFILWLRLGLWGLLLANILGILLGNIYSSSKVGYFSFKKFSLNITTQHKKEMLKYSIPLIFTGLAWWVNSSLDRFFISYFCGMGGNGLYAIANKIPTLLTAFHSIIYQAMQLSVFTEIKASDSKLYLKKMYNIYNFLMVIACSAIIILDKPLASFLFKNEYYIAWKYVPALVLSTVLFSVSGYITIIAAVSNNTKTIATATISGAIVNAILNILLIPKFELYGAVIATVIGYFIIWFVMIIKAEHLLEVKFFKVKSIVMYLLLVIQWVILLYIEHSFIFELIIFMIICIINHKTVMDLINLAKDIVIKFMMKVSNKK